MKIVKDLKPDETPRYMRAFDFLKGPEKDAALQETAFGPPERDNKMAGRLTTGQ